MNTRRYTFASMICCLASFVAFGQREATPVYVKFRTDKIYILDQQRVEIIADLYIGTWENPAQNLYAVSFDLIFPTDVTASELTSFIYNSQSFFGKAADVTVAHKNLQTLKEGRLNIVISRNDLKSANGFGKIGEVVCVTTHDIIGSRDADETPFTVKAEYVQLLDVDGNELPSETDPDGATVIIVNDILARNAGPRNLQQVEIFPNPAHDQVLVQLRNLRGERVELFNVNGQRVKRDQVREDLVRLDTKDLRAGLYTVKIFTEQGTITRRVLIQ